jgi:multidrug transporter EmrE-like cation transporter
LIGAALEAVGMPGRWSLSLTALAAMVVLAALDFIGAIFAKEWTERQGHWLFLAGLATFGTLFTVYALVLKTAELSIVTIGWVVILQVGLVLIDRFRYGVELSGEKWLAIALNLLLQGYLVLAPNGASGS